MALRPQTDDYLHNFRFQASATDADGANRLVSDGRPQAGFSTVGTPEKTVEVAEYKEGIDIYMQKFPGNPSVNDITFNRGVARADSAFWDWLRVVVEGSGGYRATVTITQYHRIEALTRNFPVPGFEENVTRIPADAEGMLIYLYNAFPIRHKVSSDLDATSSDVSVMELDIAYEYYELDYLAAA